MTVKKRAKKVYKTVRSLLNDPRRWGRHHYESHGRYCLYGAIDRVYGEESSDRRSDAVNRLRAALGILGRDFGGVAYFNDNPGTTHQDILRVIRKAKI